MKRTSYLLILVSFMMFSCVDSNSDQPNTAERRVTFEDVSFELNDESKWLVPKDMGVHLTSSFERIKQEQGQSERNYVALSEDLVQLRTELISSCTMKGKGHDILHQWLVPYSMILRDLKTAEGTDELEELLNELVESESVFYEYFELES